MRSASPLIQGHLGGAFQHDFLRRRGAHVSSDLQGSLLFSGRLVQLSQGRSVSCEASASLKQQTDSTKSLLKTSQFDGRKLYKYRPSSKYI